MREEFSDVVEFVYIYIKEAHPEDEWQMDSNVEKGVVFMQPTTMEERLQLAQTFVSAMEIEGPMLVDEISNIANACFAAWPERLYVVGIDGRIAYKGGMGPFRFDPGELEDFLGSSYRGSFGKSG